MSVNFLLGSKIGNWPATPLCGLLFIVAAAIGFIFWRRRFSLASIILTAAAVAWLPLFVHFAATLGRESADSWDVLFLPQDQQIVWRYCRIDQNQHLGGGFCNIYPFYEEVRRRIPEGASVSLADSVLGPYMAYYLYPSYKTAYGPAGDYVVVYRPARPFVYEEGQLFQIIDGRAETWGAYEMIAKYSAQEMILKRK